jgi:threonine aldolase
MPIDQLRAIRKVADEAEAPVYLDGARIFNASVAAEVPVEEYAAEVEALMFCLSKGLGAPIGSVLCGSSEFIREARRAKVLFGGAWRQAGIVAAAGLVALDEGPGRLAEDHANARRLAEGVASVTPSVVDPVGIETNMVFCDTAAIDLSPWRARARLGDAGILSNVVAGKLRLVTHRDVTREDVDETVSAWRDLVADEVGPATGEEGV